MTVMELLDATTRIYRPGPEVTETEHAGIRVQEVWIDTPHADDATVDADLFPLIDVHFFKVSVDLIAARAHRDEFVRVCEAWPPDATYNAENGLAAGPSYIEMGAQIGTFMGQQDAMRFMALGEALGVWSVVTPERLGLRGADADRAAGAGYIMTTGYHGV